MIAKTRNVLLLIGLGFCIVPVATYYVARHQLCSRIRVPVKPTDLTISSVHVSRYGGIQIEYGPSASASPELKELMTRITPVWSLFPVEKHQAEWHVNLYTGSGIYWDDYYLTQ